MAEEPKQSAKDRLRAQVAQAFARVGKLTRLQRLLICVVTTALIGGSYYYFIYRVKTQELVKVEKELKLQSEKLNTYRIRAKTLKKWEKKMADKEHAFHLAMKELPDKKELPSLLRGVSSAGSRAGLNFLLFQPASEVNKEFYKEIPLSITVEGSYHQITDFFYRVAKQKRIVNIKDMNMKRNAGSGQIQMSCNAVTYMFVESQDPKKKKKKKK